MGFQFDDRACPLLLVHWLPDLPPVALLGAPAESAVTLALFAASFVERLPVPAASAIRIRACIDETFGAECMACAVDNVCATLPRGSCVLLALVLPLLRRLTLDGAAVAQVACPF